MSVSVAHRKNRTGSEIRADRAGGFLSSRGMWENHEVGAIGPLRGCPDHASRESPTQTAAASTLHHDIIAGLKIAVSTMTSAWDLVYCWWSTPRAWMLSCV